MGEREDALIAELRAAGAEREKLASTARSLERWQGSTETMITEISRRLNETNATIAALGEQLSGVLVELSVVRTKVALWASVGAILGAAVVSALVGMIFR